MVWLLAQSDDPSNQPLQIFGTKLIGITPLNAHRLLITVVYIVAVGMAYWLLRLSVRLLIRGSLRRERVVFWARQAISLVLAIALLIGILSIWFSDPTRLATFMGLVTAGVAFALQKPISALAGYLVILRGKTFGVGDRITMGGVRGDVIALRFTQTTIMEMGQPPSVQGADPAMWVEARQYTGRIVTISNSTVFDEPVYNYSREFPYIWDEMHLPISYKDDRERAEQILLDVAKRLTVKKNEINQDELKELTRRYFLPDPDVEPRVYFRLTDNWIEMTVRFIARTHGIRALKDAMSRQIIEAFDEAKIGIASSTYDVVGMPPIHVHLEPPSSPRPPSALS
jgi:small-conductance mechanosensitive channel